MFISHYTNLTLALSGSKIVAICWLCQTSTVLFGVFFRWSQTTSRQVPLLSRNSCIKGSLFSVTVCYYSCNLLIMMSICFLSFRACYLIRFTLLHSIAACHIRVKKKHGLVRSLRLLTSYRRLREPNCYHSMIFSNAQSLRKLRDGQLKMKQKPYLKHSLLRGLCKIIITVNKRYAIIVNLTL